MLKTILTTERLLLRELTLEDAPFMLELLNTSAYLKFIGDKNVRTIKDAEINIQSRIDSYLINGLGLWLVELKETQVSIGTCGLIKRQSIDDIDIGFAFLPAYFGKRYGYESAKATLNYAHKELQIKKVIAYTNKTNKASIGLLEKLGLQFEKMAIMPAGDSVMQFSPIKKPN